jgi:chromosome segregation ATPase
MSKGISIAIAADTKSAMSAIQRGLIDPLEDVSEQLEELEDDSTSATKKLERGMKDAQRRTEDAKDEIKDLRDELNKTGRAGKTAGADIDDGMRKAEDGVEDLKGESQQTAAEVAASFDGSAESIAGGFQELAANAFAGFGPAGAVAGLAAAAGIGLAMAGFTQTQEEMAASEERIGEWAQTFIDAGGRAATAAQVAGGMIAIATDPEQYKQAAQNAKDWGVDETTALRAMAGDANSLEVVRRTLNDRTEESNRLLAQQETQVDKNAGVAYDLADAVDRGGAAFSKLTGEMQAGADRAQTVSDGLKGIVNDAESATLEVDGLGNQLYTLPDDTQVMVSAKTGQATTDVSNFQGDLDGVPETVTTTMKVIVDDSDVKKWHAPLLQGTLQVNSVVDKFGRTWT